jgi:DNA polymerase-3 subunit epsilon/ATP-dependent DNA helicase DinG
MTTIVSVDLETTGLDSTRDVIIEVGAVRFNGRRVEDEWHTLINPRRAIPENITRLTGITNEMVRFAPNFAEVAQDLQAFVGDAPILGHNVSFDMGFLQQQGLFPYQDAIDTYALAAVLMPMASRYNLGSLGQQLGILAPATHRALDDARVTHQLFVQLWEKILALPINVLAEIVRLGDDIDWGADWIFRQAMRDRVREPIGARSVSGGALGPLFEGVGERKARRRSAPAAPLDPDPETTPLDSDEMAAILEHGGEFSRHFPQYEFRPQQVEMLRHIAWALSEGRHLMVEAGTGTGKSMAYLVPTAMWALQNNTRVVISTNTINLQDQLFTKDIPDIAEALDLPLRATVLKGRSNYVCPRRLGIMRRQGPERPDEMRVLAKVLVWLEESSSGDRQEINLRSAGERSAWERLSAADDNCTGETCLSRMGGLCPFYQVKQEAQNAHILIVNHALLLADVATGNRVLPEYEFLIVDEAHHMESAVTNALSFRITQYEVERTIRELGSTSGGAYGRLLTAMQAGAPPGEYAAVSHQVDQATSHAYQFQNHARAFFIEIDGFLTEMREGRDPGVYAQQVRILPATRTQPAWMQVEVAWDEAQQSLMQVLRITEAIGESVSDLIEAGYPDIADAYGELGQIFRRLGEYNANFNGLVFQPQAELVYWAELNPGGRRLSLHAAPLHIGPLMQEHLWHRKKAVILTSATLTTHNEFDYLRQRLFGEDADEIALGSPFDYESQTLLYIPNNIPEPSDRHGHQRAINQGLIQLCKTTGGRALVLFTSYAQLQKTAAAISGPLSAEGIVIYEQGSGASPHALLESFKDADQAVLLGTRAFWEGIDIPGEDLSVLVIVKLPFDVPSDPIISARSETFENAFQEYALPEAILKFRQGFGRLIRTQYDRGIVAIFDRRVLTKRYGPMFIQSLPECTVNVGRLEDISHAAAQWLNL